MKKILIIGAGSWGTALSVILANNGHRSYLWEYNEEYRKDLRLNRENINFLPGIKLKDNINIIDDYNKTIKEEDIDIILLATPTQFIRDIISKIKYNLKENTIIINVAKGIEINTMKRISEIISDEIANLINYSYVLLSGPTHAEEVIQNMPSAILSVSEDNNSSLLVQKLFSNNSLRVYTGNDVIGAELSGALKNCIAIAAGISDGLGYGDNTKAAIITRSFNEMMIIAEHFGAKRETLMGLTGLGDLIVTCTSKHSRNRYLGEEIGKGKKIDDIIKEMKMISEGATTIKALKKIIEENNLRAPIHIGIYDVLYNNKSVLELTASFMNRELKSEF